MEDFFLPLTRQFELRRATLPIRFDAEHQTPTLVNALSARMPAIRDILASLRMGLPLVPHSAPGRIGPFFRIPNHYRSVSFVMPSAGTEPDSVDGAIVFKGTEPLLPDFQQYFEWMLRAPFRETSLPMGLFFSLDMKLPPAAMWIEECVTEQEVTSSIQMQYFERYGSLARLPVPLFVYEFTQESVHRYQDVVRARISPAAFKRFEAKLAGGLGIEVYYYPTLPVRAADLFVGSVKSAFGGALNPNALEEMFNGWIELLADLLRLGHMPYAPWNHGMGACVDPGNACIDGGFHDLLTIVPFDSIPGEHLFGRSLSSSVRLLASSIIAVCAATTNSRLRSEPDTDGADSLGIAVSYVRERLRAHILSNQGKGHAPDARLSRFFEVPTVLDVCQHLREMLQYGPGPAQFAREQIEPLKPPSDPLSFPSQNSRAVGA